MVDLGRIQTRLNTDARYRENFLKDPVGALFREGLVLSVEMQHKLRLQVAQMKQKQGAVPGAAFPASPMEALLLIAIP